MYLEGLEDRRSISPESAHLTRPIKALSNGPLIKPVPKRAKLTRAVSLEQTDQRLPASFPRNPVADSSLIASSPSESSSNHDAGHVTSKRNVGVTRSRTVTAIRYRCPDNHDEDRDAEDVLLGRIGRISTFEGKDIDISEVLTS